MLALLFLGKKKYRENICRRKFPLFTLGSCKVLASLSLRGETPGMVFGSQKPWLLLYGPYSQSGMFSWTLQAI